MRQTLRALLLLTFLLPLPGLAASPEFSAALDAIAAGDHKSGFMLLKPLARDGNPEAQFLLGGMYASGSGTDVDEAEARKWYARAAEQGHYEAASTLGKMYASGVGAPYDPKAAQKWFELASRIAEANNKSSDCD